MVELQHVEARRRARPRHRRRRRRSSAGSPPTPTSCSRASRPARSPTLGTRPPRARAPTTSELIWVSVTPFGRDRHARARARHRPHAARRRRAGVELRVRRPLAPAGARRRQPGVPHRQHVGGDGRAHRGARARRHRARPARRREHARGVPTSPPRCGTYGWLVGAGARCSARPAGTRCRRSACPRRCAAPTAATSPPASRRARSATSSRCSSGSRRSATATSSPRSMLLDLAVERGGVVDRRDGHRRPRASTSSAPGARR